VTHHVPFLDLQAVHARHAAAMHAALDRVLASGRVLLGEETEAFEAEFAAHCGTRHAVAVGSGLDALMLALRARGIGPGDEVIVPAHTFVATWLAVMHVGARPVPVDAGEGSFQLDAGTIEAALTPRTRAVVPVHLTGHPAPMHEVLRLARRHGLFVLEDAAQAHGARLDGRRCGGLGDLGDAAAFSFYPGKNLGALGDAGAVTTDDEALARTLRRLRNYGSERKYHHELPGFNSRLDEWQAAVLRERLAVLDADNAARAGVAAAYLDAFAGLEGLVLPTVAPGAQPVWHLFVVRHAERDRLARGLAERGVQTLVHYPCPPHLQPACAALGFAPGSMPRAEALAREVLSLPIGPTMSVADRRHVIAAVREACREIA
jgi:dTDP-4-amino-4,6-dideoxygalactose transaminase